MSLKSPPRRKDDESSILPLINVVFLLLIFFMVVGQLSAVDPFEIAPPQSSSAGESSPEDLTVQVSAEGELALDGEVLSQDRLLARLRERMAEPSVPAVHVKADGDLPATRLVVLLEDLRESGVEAVTLLTVAESE